jgi:hypothetical protein
VATAIDPLYYPLHQKGPIEWERYREGSDFGISEKKGEHAFVIGWEQGNEGTALWHFVNPDKLGGYAFIYFLDENGAPQTVGKVYSYKNDQHFAVVTPQSWILTGADYYPAKAPNKGATQFNLSHTAGIPLPKTGSLAVTADFIKYYDFVTYRSMWQKEFQPYWQKRSGLLRGDIASRSLTAIPTTHW